MAGYCGELLNALRIVLKSMNTTYKINRRELLIKLVYLYKYTNISYRTIFSNS